MQFNRKDTLVLLVITSFVLLADNLSFAERFEKDEKLPASFAEAKAEKEFRQLAQAMGDDYIANREPNQLPAAQQKDVDQYIDKQIALLGSSDGQERATANEQIQRLWRLCVPKLLANLGHKNATLNEAVMKNLILMRNEKVIDDIIGKINSSTDPNVIYSGIFVLGMMNEKSYTLIPNRSIMDDTTSNTIAHNKITPFLQHLERSTDDPAIQTLIQNAYRFLEKPIDRRPKKSTANP